MEHVDRARAAGRGGIFMTVHMGSWEMAGAAMGLLGVPITAAVLKHADPRIDEISGKFAAGARSRKSRSAARLPSWKMRPRGAGSSASFQIAT